MRPINFVGSESVHMQSVNVMQFRGRRFIDVNTTASKNELTSHIINWRIFVYIYWGRPEVSLSSEAVPAVQEPGLGEASTCQP
jgi:hypothetical protein